jgi:uncharacterized membrane protein
MVRLLAALAVAWPIVMAGAVGVRAGGGSGAWSAAPFVIGEVICHRRPERSFHTAGVQWPVCGRCAGLYLAAPAGALAALVASRRRRRKAIAPIRLLAIAAVPTAVTFIAEWSGLLPMANLSRFVAALPLGAVVAWLVVGAAGGDRPIG